MIRKLILPAIAVLLLAGCATGYTYRNAPGDYYYGQPGTVYRDYYGYPSYYGGYYSPYSWRGYFGYGHYGYPYGYGRYPGHYHGGYPHSPRPGNNDGGDKTPDLPTPPWRDLDRVGELRGRPDVPRAGELRTRPVQQPAMPQVRRPATPVQRPATHIQRPVSRSRAEAGGSRMSEMIRRAQPNRDTGPTSGE